MNHDDMGGSSSHGSGSSAGSDSMSSMHGGVMMVPYFHFTQGDAVLFRSIIPTSPGAIFGVCLVFFLVAILDRWLHAYRRGVENRFVERARLLQIRLSDNENSGKKSLELEPCCDPPPPSKFILTHELSRALLTGLSTTVHYILMLVVMTFNVAYLISIIAGVTVGEFAFGRLYR